MVYHFLHVVVGKISLVGESCHGIFVPHVLSFDVEPVEELLHLLNVVGRGHRHHHHRR